jgi:hypothetical protein
LVLVGWTAEKGAGQVSLEAADGTRTPAPILYTLHAALDRRYFAFPVDTTTGTLLVEDVDGKHLLARIRVKVQ